MFMGFRKYAGPQPTTIMKRAKSAGEASTASSNSDDYEVSESELQQSDLTLHTIHNKRRLTTPKAATTTAAAATTTARKHSSLSASSRSLGQYSNVSSTEILLRSQYLEVQQQKQPPPSSLSDEDNNKKMKRIATIELLKSQIYESYNEIFENSKLPDKSHTYPKFLEKEVQIGKLLGQGGFANVYEVTGFTLSHKDFQPLDNACNTASATTSTPAASTTPAAAAADDKKEHKQPPLPPPLPPQQLQPHHHHHQQQQQQQQHQPLCEDEDSSVIITTKKEEDLEKKSDDDDDDDDDDDSIINRNDKFESINLNNQDNDDDDHEDDSFSESKDFMKCNELQQKLDYQHQMAAREFLTKHCFRPSCSNNNPSSDVGNNTDSATTTTRNNNNDINVTPTITDSSTITNGGVDSNNVTTKKMDARYALKRLKPSVIADSDHLMQGISDMATESRFLASLEYHPNIIKLRGMAKERFTSQYFIIMDKLGDTLEQRINNVWRPKEKKSKSSKFNFTKVIHKFKKLSSFGSTSSPTIRDLGSGSRKKPYNSGGDLRGSGGDGGRANGLSSSLPNKKWNTYNNNDNNGSSSLSSSNNNNKKWYDQITLPSRLQTCYGIASALGHLHKHRILYRDLKPANVGFDVRDDVKIFDFGLAKELLLSSNATTTTNDDDDNNTNNNAVYNLTMLCGTPRYMAPEVARGEPYNETCDVYSFAILCWQILRLRVPYGKKCNFDLLHKVWFDEDNIIRPEIPKTSSWPIPIQQMLQNAFQYDLTQRPKMNEMKCILKKEYGVVVSSRSNCRRSQSSGGDGGGGGEDVTAAAAAGVGTSKTTTTTTSKSDNHPHDDNDILDDSLRSSSMSAAKKRRSTHIFGSGRAMGMKADGFGLERRDLFEGVSSSGRLSILGSSSAENIASDSMEMLNQQETEELEKEEDDDSIVKSSSNMLKSTATTPTASAAESQQRSIEKSSDLEDS